MGNSSSRIRSKMASISGRTSTKDTAAAATDGLKTSVNPLSRSDLETAIQKYGPVIRMHPDEAYDMCSVEWFLAHSTLVDSQPPTAALIHPTGEQLPQGPKENTRYYLQIEEEVKPGKQDTATAYVNAFWDKVSSYTDLQFWLFWAYNGPGTAKFDSLLFNKVLHTGNVDLKPLGEHVGDWEYVTIRIDHASKEMIGILLSAHGKAAIYDKAAIAKSFKFENNTHPVVYSSRNGHANFPGVGPNFTEQRKVLGTPVGLEFNLLNTTADGGNTFATYQSFEIVASNFLTGSDAISSPAWVKYPYRWGPEGTAVNWNAKTLGDFIKAALGDDVSPLLLDNVFILIASALLQVFVRADINGAAAPATQGPWVGNY